jgi:hypothetical protein
MADEFMTVQELKALAEKKKIPIPSGARKMEIIEIIQEAVQQKKKAKEVSVHPYKNFTNYMNYAPVNKNKTIVNNYYTVPEIKQIAEKNGIETPSKILKEDLIDLVNEILNEKLKSKSPVKVPKSASPVKPKAASPKPKAASPKPKAASPKPKAASPKQPPQPPQKQPSPKQPPQKQPSPKQPSPTLNPYIVGQKFPCADKEYKIKGTTTSKKGNILVIVDDEDGKEKKINPSYDCKPKLEPVEKEGDKTESSSKDFNLPKLPSPKINKKKEKEIEETIEKLRPIYPSEEEEEIITNLKPSFSEEEEELNKLNKEQEELNNKFSNFNEEEETETEIRSPKNVTLPKIKPKKSSSPKVRTLPRVIPKKYENPQEEEEETGPEYELKF